MERGGQLDQVLQQRPGEVLKLAGIENNDFLANNQGGCTKLAQIGWRVGGQATVESTLVQLFAKQ